MSVALSSGLENRARGDVAEDERFAEGGGTEVAASVEGARHFARGIEAGNHVAEDVGDFGLPVDLDAAVGRNQHGRGGEDVERGLFDRADLARNIDQVFAPEVAVDARRLRVLVVAVHGFAHDLRVEPGLLGHFFDRVAFRNR